MDLKVGPRYAFFSGGGSSPEYQYAMAVGQGCVSNLRSQLSNSSNDDTNGHHLNKIKTYIEFIKGVASSAQENEINFIKKIDSLYDEKYLGTELKQHLTTLIQGINEGNFNYMQFISVISDFMNRDDEHYQERIQRYHENMQVIDHNYKLLEWSAKYNDEDRLILESIQETNQKNYYKYRALAVKYLINPLLKHNGKIDKEFQSSVTTLISTRFKSVMKNLINSSELIAIIKSQVLGQGLDGSTIAMKIRTVVLKWLSSLDLKTLTESNGQSLASQFMTEFNSNYEVMLAEVTDAMVDQSTALFESKKKKNKNTATFEEIALTTEQGLADLFESLDESSKDKIIKLNPTLLTELHINAKKLKTRSAKMKFTSALRDTIRDTFKQLGFKMPNGTKEEIRNAINDFIRSHNDILGTTNIKEIINNNFNVRTSGGSMGEWLSANASRIFREMIVHGSKTKFKTDMSVTVTWNEKLDFNFANEKQKEELQKSLINFMPNMFEEMKKINIQKGNRSEQTDVDTQVQAYLQIMSNIKNLINKLESQDANDEQQRQQLLKQLSSFFLESISVKDYDFYANDLGFHGGSLGGGNAPANVISNITKMYKLGGITPIDEGLLMFGVMNCAGGMIAAGMQEDIATYLLGGAAMLMFDDGFTNAEAFLSSVKQDFGFAMAPLHLYRLQGRIVPASYIYSAIYNNLCQVYSQLEIETSLETLSSSRCHVNIINNASTADIATNGTLQERWDKTASNVQGKISITFSFMAGLLDIFNAIPQAFNI